MAEAAKVPRGVAPGDAERYAAATFDCGGGRSVPAACVNDGYCDCESGGSNDDEPGTGACAFGRFFCRNRGHRGESVAASRVNDGVCDCCDGSDEWARPDARCTDTCRALGAATRAAERRALDAAAAGLSARAAAADAARTTLARMRSELGARRAALAAAEAEMQRLDEIRARVQERETRKAEQQKKKEEEGAAEKQPTEMVAEPTMQEAKAAVGWEVPTAADGVESNEQQKPATTEAEEEGGGKTVEDPELEALKEDVAVADTVEEPAKEEEVSDDGGEDDDEEDSSRTSRAWDAVRTFVVGDKWLGKPALWRRTVYPFVWAWHRVRELISDDTFKHEDEEFWCPSPPATVFNPKTRKAQSEVDAARHKVEDIKAEVQKLEKLLDTDFGEDSCFYSLHGTCVEIKKDEYTYELCPFDKATQKGGSHTSLGTWDRWGDDHKAMHFEHGVKCWNGPERNVRVDLECGVENKLLDASEPARCEYVFKMSTPCACTQEAADALAVIIKQHEIDDREDD